MDIKTLAKEKKYNRHRYYFIIVILKTEMPMAEVFVYIRPPEGQDSETSMAVLV